MAGLRVLDLTRVLAGPLAGKWLATMGAEVIKVENPNAPDVTRDYTPFVNGQSGYFITINHNKRGVTVNLKTESGKKLFKELVKTADVVLENYRPGVMDRLGVGYEELKKVNPGLVYASISGYGTYGPYKDRPGYDCIAQAVSGLMYLTGPAGGEPTRVGSSIGDAVGGVTSLVAILAALYCKKETGLGQKVEVALVDSLISLSAQEHTRYFVDGVVAERIGNIYRNWTPYGSYPAADGYFAVGCGTDQFFKQFAEAIGHPELSDMEAYCTMSNRMANREQLDEIIYAWAADKKVKDICALLVDAGVPCGPVNSIRELAEDEHIAGAREMFPTFYQPGVGDYRTINVPMRFEGSGLATLAGAPGIGADNEEIYGALGYSAEELASLRENGVI